MDKYGVEIDPQLEGLLQEEASLMTKVAGHMTSGDKTASDYQQTERALSAVRSKIYELRKISQSRASEETT